MMDNVGNMLWLMANVAQRRSYAYEQYMVGDYNRAMTAQFVALVLHDEFREMYAKATQAEKRSFIDAYYAWRY